MRKEIELSPELLKDIKILAAHDGTNPKKYIETLVIAHVSQVKKGSRKLLK